MGVDSGNVADVGDVGPGLFAGPPGAAHGRSLRHPSPDVVDVLIRDLRGFVRVVDRVGRGAAPQDQTDPEEFGRFVTGLAIHLVIEDLVVRPIIRRVLERHGVVEERKAAIQLIVRRAVKARHLDAGARFETLMRGVRLDLAEHAQCTEIGLLSHAYRVYDEQARRTLACRHPQATAQMFGEISRRYGDDRHVVPDLDRRDLAWLERIASETLDVEGLSTPSAIKAVPPGETAPRAAARRPPRDVGDLGPGSPDPRSPLPRPE